MASSDGSIPSDPPTVHYGTDPFDDHLQNLLADDAAADPQLAFYGGTREQHQQALADLTRHATGTVHQFEVPSLLEDQRIQTQNNLRKAFDHAAEESALLYFDQADAFFVHDHTDTPEDPEEDAALTLTEYVLDRLEAYDGVAVLGLHDPSHVEQAREAIHLVVRFE